MPKAVGGKALNKMSAADLKKQIDDQAERLRALVRQRDGLDRQIEAGKNRLEAYEHAYALVTGQAVPAESFLQNGEIVTPKGRIRPVLHHADPWEDALIVLRKRGEKFTTDEVIDEAKSRGSDIDRTKARSRLAHLVERKTLNRVSDGVFEFPKDAAA